MPAGLAVLGASSGFRFSSPHLRVVSATTLSFGTMVALDCSDSCFPELSQVPSGKTPASWQVLPAMYEPKKMMHAVEQEPKPLPSPF